jgi:hypothetical protein
MALAKAQESIALRITLFPHKFQAASMPAAMPDRIAKADSPLQPSCTAAARLSLRA